MTAAVLMIQGTGSNVGKSLLVAALCRIFRQDGLRVAPFKAQNMSNNAYVCRDGGEIARAQTLQAMSCGIEPRVEMNPILLKPCSETGSQVIVMGKPVGTMDAKAYQQCKPTLLPSVRTCLDRLRNEFDLVVIEGAGSPAEINLRDHDIANMGTAELVDAPVLLVGDINLGGVFAQLIGTLHVLNESDRARIKGLIINKFRGDLDILKPGIEYLERESGRPLLGVLPYFTDLHLPEEDSLAPRQGSDIREKTIHIDVFRHPRIANFTDFEPLQEEPDVSLRYVDRPDAFQPDVIILPGTKSTISDLCHLKSTGYARYVHRCVQRAVTVIGICGGFQMLGERLYDPERIESSRTVEPGLGLLPMTTVFAKTKQTAQIRALHLASEIEVTGYEIHMGKTERCGEPVFRVVERSGQPVDSLDGASVRGGSVWGTYLHGLFDDDTFRTFFLNHFRRAKGWEKRPVRRRKDLDTVLNNLANRVRASLDMNKIRQILAGTRLPSDQNHLDPVATSK